MSNYETKVEMAELNKELAELWIEETDMYFIHRNFSTSFETRAVRALNSLHRQRTKCMSIIRGDELRRIFYGD